ncbi:MAG: MerR family transcriptional regulator [Flexilinea sp.]
MKAVVKETGLTPATLCAWERRYGLFKPQRSPGGHRLYSGDEINLLKWLVEKQKEGLSISRAVDLWRSQVNRSQEFIQDPSVSRVPPAFDEAMLSQLSQNWYEAYLAFNEPQAELAIAKALANRPVEAASFRPSRPEASTWNFFSPTCGRTILPRR